MKSEYNIPAFETILKQSPLWQSETFKERWNTLSPDQKLEYIIWFYSDRTKSYEQFLDDPGRRPPGSAPISEENIRYFGDFTKKSLISTERGGSRRRRRRSIPKSSRKYKKSAKRVFRKKSRSTRRR